MPPTIRDTAKVRLAALKKGYPKMEPKLSPDAKAIKNRIEAEQIPEAAIQRGIQKKP